MLLNFDVFVLCGITEAGITDLLLTVVRTLDAKDNNREKKGFSRVLVKF